MSNSQLILGPLKFTHQVQKISVNEQKSVEVLRTTRSNKNFIIDNAESVQRASIQLLFSGANQINEHLRRLIALFKISPFTTVRNELLSTSWKRVDKFYDEENLRKINNFVKKSDANFNRTIQTVAEGKEEISRIVKNFTLYNNVLTNIGIGPLAPTDNNGQVVGITKAIPVLKSNVTYTDNIPVALESISAQTVDSMPETIAVNITITRIDTEPMTGPDLYYRGKGANDSSPNPEDAYWLKKWIETIVRTNIIPTVTSSDFNGVDISWVGETLAGESLETQSTSSISFKKQDMRFDSSSTTKVMAESCSIENYFGYQKLVGKGTHTAQHTGSSGRMYSIDLLFNSQKSDEEFDTFCRFKESSDEIIRSVDRFNRVNGWSVKSPITKLFGLRKAGLGKASERTMYGVYVPLSFNIETNEQPLNKFAKVDMAENDLSFINAKEGVIISGGSSISELSAFFKDVVVPGEHSFRLNVRNNPAETAKVLAGLGTSPELSSAQEMYKLFWPFTVSNVEFTKTDTLGILNIDTIRAAVLADSDVLQAMKNSSLATGKIVVGPTNPGLLTRVSLNLAQLRSIIELREPEVATAIKRTCSAYFNFLTTEEYEALSTYLTVSMFGDIDGIFSTTRQSAEAIALLSKSKVEFTPKFIDKLFDVVINRKTPIEVLKNTYDIAGLYNAFYKLSTTYIQYLDSHPTSKTSNKESVDLNKSVYDDLLLPTYFQLFGKQWKDFAPTYDDLGLINWSTAGGMEEEDAAFIQSALAVSSSDTVEPHVFYHSKRYKPELRAALEAGADIATAHMHGLSLSIPFNTKGIKKIKQILEERLKEDGKGKDFGTEALTEIILPALKAHKADNREGFDQDMEALRKAAATNYEELLNNQGVKIYYHHADNMKVPYKLTMPGLGGEIYRVASENEMLNKSDYPEDKTRPTPDVDAGYRAVANTAETLFMRHLDDNTKRTVQSSLDQIPDDYRSASKMFPVAKVYLIDRRGDDIIVDDVLASIGSILSIDITLDKDDADLAVIKIADPLFALQDGRFPSGNTITSLDNDGKIVSRKALANPRGDENLLRHYKIVQGRPIQIRLGYSAIAKNLPIVFTGKITEVAPGDVLTIVAQGWKAELISRQVAFSNPDPKNWGAKDLAVQAIQEASPAGMGEWIPQNSANYILASLSKLDIADQVTQALNNVTDTAQVVGSRGYLKDIANYLKTLSGGRSLDQNDVGIDTRLKNIWYPDTIAYNNWLGLRSKFGFNPAFINDGWVVPMQPSWEVLKEASRHAWNCIVQVVPYDTEATIFFGHPDQPYYWTRGESITRSRWRKYVDRVNKQNEVVLKDVYNGFLNSSLYDNGQTTVGPSGRTGTLYELLAIYGVGSGLERVINYSVFPTYTVFKNDYPRFSSIFERDNKDVLNAYIRIKSKLKDRTAPIVLSTFFGLDPRTVQQSWPTADQDIMDLLSSDNPILSEQLESRLGNMESSDSMQSAINTLRQLVIEQRYVNQLVPNATIGFDTTNSTAGRLRDMVRILDKLFTSSGNDGLKASVLKFKLFIVSTKSTFLGINRNEANEALVEYYKRFTQYIDDLENNYKVSDDRRAILKSQSTNISQILTEDKFLFGGLLYFFDKYLSETDEGRKAAESIQVKYKTQISPTMRTFRVHHWVDSDTDIIQNNIVATTSEMWNTTIVECPAQGSESSAVANQNLLAQSNKYYSAVKWTYYPKQEVSGVIGLQFNPALTLANKKINVVTELNCHSEELQAKLACVNLAEGIRKMYRGTLIIRGRNIKPYDRIVLDDKYNKMAGPIEVESVVHHWNPSQGWITNILPQAVCDANPGAAIIQTGLMEATYRRIFSAIDFATDAITMALIVATLGGGLIARGSSGVISTGAKKIAKDLSRGGIPRVIYKASLRSIHGLKVLGKDVLMAGRGNPISTLNLLLKESGGLVTSLAKNYMFASIADGATHVAFKLNVIPAFVQASQKAKQLPVILSPLVQNGIAFTAGLETDDSIYSIFSNSTFYSFKNMQVAASKLINELMGDDKVSIR